MCMRWISAPFDPYWLAISTMPARASRACSQRLPSCICQTVNRSPQTAKSSAYRLRIDDDDDNLDLAATYQQGRKNDRGDTHANLLRPTSLVSGLWTASFVWPSGCTVSKTQADPEGDISARVRSYFPVRKERGMRLSWNMVRVRRLVQRHQTYQVQ